MTTKIKSSKPKSARKVDPELAEFQAGLVENSEDAGADNQDLEATELEDALDITDEMVWGEEQSAYQKASLTIALQILPDDGHPKGRPVIVMVKSEQVTRPIQLFRLSELEPLPTSLTRLLGELELELNSASSNSKSLTISNATKPTKETANTSAPALPVVIRPTASNIKAETKGQTANNSVQQPATNSVSSGVETTPVKSTSTEKVLAKPPLTTDVETASTTTPAPSKLSQGPRQTNLFDLL